MIPMTILATILATNSTQVIVSKPSLANPKPKVVIVHTIDRTVPNWMVREKRFIQKFHTNTVTVVKEVK